jgi:hypothetical protein
MPIDGAKDQVSGSLWHPYHNPGNLVFISYLR